MIATQSAKETVTREATVEDLPMMEETARMFFASSSHLRDFDIAVFSANWKALIISGIGVIYCIVEDGVVVGALGGMSYLDVNSGENVAAECFWFVRPDFRGNGVGLYRRFHVWAKNRGCTQIRMAFLSDSMPVKVENFYKRLGFHEVERLYAKDIKT